MRPTIKCGCKGASCVLCDDNGNRPLDEYDIARVRRIASAAGFRETVAACDRATGCDDDAVAWLAVAEAMS